MGAKLKVFTVNAWDRRDDETGAAYKAFCVYRDMGPERTLSGACRNASGMRSKEGPNRVRKDSRNGSWRRWYEKFDWHLRAIAFDRQNEAITQQAREHE